MNLDELEKIIAERRAASPETSYTAKLLAGGVDRIGKKIGEEAAELIIAAKNADEKEIAWEASDLFYHSLVILAATGVPLAKIYAELERRHGDKQDTGK
jgi:phosphoribosyl-ATP pyrophosphohydrolase/phosphoribosyl-AMP cyclohydrolase